MAFTLFLLPERPHLSLSLGRFLFGRKRSLRVDSPPCRQPLGFLVRMHRRRLPRLTVSSPFSLRCFLTAPCRSPHQMNVFAATAASLRRHQLVSCQHLLRRDVLPAFAARGLFVPVRSLKGVPSAFPFLVSSPAFLRRTKRLILGYAGFCALSWDAFRYALRASCCPFSCFFSSFVSFCIRLVSAADGCWLRRASYHGARFLFFIWEPVFQRLFFARPHCVSFALVALRDLFRRPSGLATLSCGSHSRVISRPSLGLDFSSQHPANQKGEGGGQGYRVPRKGKKGGILLPPPWR